MSVRVLHLIKSLGRGGAETLLVEGYRVADHSRFSLEYAFFLDQHDEMANLLRAQGAHVHSFGVRTSAAMMMSVPRVVQFLRERRIDLVHAHLPLAGAIARVAGRIAGVPTVYTEHNPTNSYHPLTQALSRATWGLGTRAIAISPDVEVAMRRHGGARVPIDLVLNGIDTDKFDPTRSSGDPTRRALGIAPEAPVVGAVGMFRRQKRYDVWIAAARHILDELPEAHFVLIGAGTELDATREQADRLGLTNRVSFVGGQTDVRPFLAAMDLFMMSSEYEGFGLAPIEAMSMTVPVVATDVDGIRTVVQNGSNCTLVPFDEHVSEALATAAVALLREPERQSAYRVAGREAAVRQFGLRQMQGHLEQIYADILRTHMHSPTAEPCVSPGVGGADASPVSL